MTNLVLLADGAVHRQLLYLTLSLLALAAVPR